MTTEALIAEMEQQGIKLWVEEDQLKFRAPKGALTGERAAKLKASKQEIISLLSSGASSAISKVEKQDDYELSHAQLRLWLVEQIEQQSTAYLIPLALQLSGDLDLKHLQEAIDGISKRHEILRTAIIQKDGVPRQRVIEWSPEASAIQFIDLSTEQDAETAALEKANEFMNCPFDLSKGHLWSLYLLKLSDQRHVLLVSMHHIISDGWSIRQFISELSSANDANVKGASVNAKELAIQYRDYAAWQNSRIKDGYYQKHKEYWLDKLGGSLPVLELPIDYPRPPVQTFEGDEAVLAFSQKLSNKLDAIGKSNGASRFMLLTALVKALLYRCTGESDIIVGVPVANRENEMLADQLGLYINTFALRDYVDGEKPFSELLSSVKSSAIDAYKYQEYPFDVLVDELSLARDTSRGALFDVMVIMQDVGEEQLQSGAMKIEPFSLKSHSAKVDLTFNFHEYKGAIHASVEYNTDLFEAQTIDNMLSIFECMAESICEEQSIALNLINILPDNLRDTIVTEVNKTEKPLPENQTVVDVFRQQVEKSPDAPAVTVGDKTISYMELDERSDLVAAKLKAVDVGPGSLVGLATTRSFDIVVGLWGILKSGAGYVPMDPHFPASRIKQMISSAGVTELLTSADIVDNLDYVADMKTVIQLDANGELVGSEDASSTAVPEGPKQSDTAYVIYTSGSTGVPKGVEISHEAALNFLLSMQACPGMEAGDRILALTTISFDIAVLELYLPMMSGAQICMASYEDALDANSLISLINKNKISIVQATPATWQMMLDAGWEGSQSIKALCGGEALTSQLAKDLFPRTESLYNMYGPTETTVWSSLQKIEKADINPDVERALPIGEPIDNTQLYILDAQMQVVPTGVAGDLYIGGSGLAKGYFGDESLTEDRFITGPDSLNGDRLYKTGDIARLRHDGIFEFLGRSDNQVKVRGFRIELGEIESVLNQNDSVKEAVVVPHTDPNGEIQLVGYIRLSESSELDSDLLKQDLKAKVPAYMVPGYFVCVEKWPLTPNNKVDRKALPRPDFEDAADDTEIIEPRNKMEADLSEIWKAVLKRERISVEANFFDMGGHSLSATRLVAQIQKDLNLNVSLLSIFQNPTIASLAISIQESDATESIRIPIAEEKSRYALSHAQRRLWILNQSGVEQDAYIIPSVLELNGKLSREHLESAIKFIVERHASLRTTFGSEQGEPYQLIHSNMDVPLEYIDLSKETNVDAAAEASVAEVVSSSFDLSAGPLLKTRLVSKSEESHLLAICIHHIVSDKWSLDVLLEELSHAYTVFSQGRQPELAELELQYHDYSEWQASQSPDVFEAHKQYWVEQFADEIPVLEMPLDFQRPLIQSFEGDSEATSISSETTESFSALCRKENCSTFLGVVGLVNVLLNNYTGQTDLVVGTPVAGRDYPGLDNQVGFYVNTLALRNQLNPNDSFQELLKQVKASCESAFAHQDLPFDGLVEMLNIKRDTSRSPLFDVMISYQKNDGDTESLRIGDAEGGEYDSGSRIAHFDLTLHFIESASGITVGITYNTKLFKVDRIKRMLAHLSELINSIVISPDSSISELTMLPKDELKQIDSFSDRALPIEDGTTLISIFENTVRTNPDHLAFVDELNQRSYAMLDQLSNTVARRVSELAPVDSKETVVAVMLEKPADLTTALLGIMKAGAVYLPIDHAYPAERIDYLLQDSQAGLVLVDDNTQASMPESSDLNLINVNDIDFSEEKNFDSEIQPSDAAYLIYTSGSTGKPKGVLVEHSAIVNTAKSLGSLLSIGSEDRVIQFASPSFDASLMEILMALMNNATLVGVNRDQLRTPEGFTSVVKDYGVTITLLPPSFLRMFDKSAIPGLRVLLTGGEAVIEEDARHYAQLCEFYNVYGPTEGAIACAMHKVEKDNAYPLGIPIGHSFPNTKIIILDEAGRVAPIGVAGEICLAGPSLARGYHQRDELTKKAFCEAPFDSSIRLYHTGDMGRRLEDGSILCLGRKDDQVKIRGYRIELGEIRENLIALDYVNDAIVMAESQSGADTQLVAYLSGSDTLDLTEIRQELSKSLPHYMIPAKSFQVSEIPMTTSGKVDKAKLKQSVISSNEVEKTKRSPETELQKALIVLWSELLGVQDIGIDDDFFEVGGHSLLGIKLLSRIEAEFATKITLTQFFNLSTIDQLASHIESTNDTALEEIEKIKDAADYAVSHAQQRLWLLESMLSDKAAYNITSATRIKGVLNEDVLSESLQLIVNRHESLRTVFRESDSGPRQVVLNDMAVAIDTLDLSSVSENEGRAKDMVIAASETHFDLKTGPLFAVTIIKLAPNDSVLVLNMHHIISDGWSLEVMIEELLETYSKLNKKQAPDLAALNTQYRDFAAWQNKQLEGEGQNESARYWHSVFEKPIPVLDMPMDHPRPAVQVFDGSRVSVKIPSELVGRLKNLAREKQCAPFAVYLTSVATLLKRYCGQDEMVVGTPVSGRSHPALSNQIGFFVNMLALRLKLNGSADYASNLLEVNKVLNDSLAHEEYPFDRLVDELELDRDMSRNPLFDVIVTHQGAGAKHEMPEGLEVEAFEAHPRISKFDLSFSFFESRDGDCELDIEFATALFSRERVERMANHLTVLLASICEKPNSAVSELPIMGPEELQKVTETFAKPMSDYPRESTIVDLFLQYAESVPDRQALVSDAESMTYAELDQRSNGLAQYLIEEKGVQAGESVALLMEKSVWSGVALLAILKAGAVYVPIDTAYPRERKEYIVKDANARVVITEASLADGLDLSATLVDVREHARPLEQCSIVARTATDRAYIMYTSGSTGQPKGSIIPQRAVVRLVKNTNFISITEDDVLIQAGSIAFDASTFEIWGALLNGASVAFPDRDTMLEAPKLEKFYVAHKVSTTFMTAGLFNQFADIYPQVFKHLRVLMVGGEKLSPPHINKIRSAYAHLDIVNGYGPTENTTFTACFSIREEYNSDIPIGYPVANSTAYVLDANDKPVPVGVPGELCSGGDGLSDGYLNNDELTAKSFVNIASLNDELVYRTGDRAAWQNDGTLRYLGRIDTQVKIRGFRIEPQEIEYKLINHKAITEAAVVARNTSVGTKELIGYYVSDAELSSTELRAHLLDSLPDYMVPAQFVWMAVFPLTSNGKVDLRRLPEPSESEEDISIDPPQNEKEQIVCNAWKSVLGINSIGRNHDYFELGGDSIKAIQIVSRIRKEAYDLSVRDLFQCRTIAETAKVLVEAKTLIDQSPVSGMVPATGIHAWFDAHIKTDKHHFNQTVLLEPTETLTKDALSAALTSLSKHHDMLRAVYNPERGALEIQEESDFQLSCEFLQINAGKAGLSKMSEHLESVQSGFSLEGGPLVKVICYEAVDMQRLAIVAHHLIVDGVSWRILLDDLRIAYRQSLAGERIVLPAKTLSYIDWANKQREIYQAIDTNVESEFWQVQCNPKDANESETVNCFGDASEVSRQLSQDDTKRLLRNTSAAYNTTIEDVLLASLAGTLKEWNGQDESVVMLEGHGRDDAAGIDVTRTLGWFTAVYPFKLKASSLSISDQIKITKESLRMVPRKGTAYCTAKYVENAEQLSNLSDGLISFNYLGEFDSATGDLFSFAPESSGNPISPNCERPHKLDITAMVSDGRLAFSVIYNRNEYTKDEALKLLEQFEKALLSVVEQCESVSETEPTPSDFELLNFSLEEYEHLLEANNWNASDIEDMMPLTSLQSGLMFEVLRDPDTSAYQLQMSYDIVGKLDEDAFSSAWNTICSRHSILRTAFLYEDVSEPIQVVLKKRGIDVEFIDCQDVEVSRRADATEEARIRDLDNRFDLSRDNLIRLQVLRFSDELYTIILSYHHLVLDGWSLSVVFDEFMSLYQAASTTTPISLSDAQSYGKYLRWLSKQDRQTALDYWESYLAGTDDLTSVPSTNRSDNAQAAVVAEHSIQLSEEQTEILTSTASRLGVTLNSIVQSLWGLLLSKYTGKSDVVFGAIVSGRPADLEGVEEMVGLFINSLPVRVTIDANDKLSDLVTRVHNESVSGQDYHHVNLAEIQSLNNQRQELFDHLIVFENYPVEEELLNGSKAESDFRVESLKAHDNTHYNFDITVTPGTQMHIRFAYNQNEYSDKRVQDIGSHLLKLMTAFIAEPAQQLSSVSIMSEEETEWIMDISTGPQKSYPLDKPIHVLSSEQAALTPDKIAIEHNGKSFTYAEVDALSNQLARKLMETGVARDGFVAIVYPRSCEFLVAMLAVMKAGAAYIPVDPAYPLERIQHMVTDSQAATVIVSEDSITDVEGHVNDSQTVLTLDLNALSEYSSEAVPNVSEHSDNAYMLYTSGSTGLPKGALVRHNGAVNHIFAEFDALGFHEDTVFLQSAPSSSDISVWQFLAPQLIGGKTVVADFETVCDVVALHDLMIKQKVSVFEFVPTVLTSLLSYIESLPEGQRDLPAVESAMVTGEEVSPNLVNRWLEFFPNIAMVNAYGPTEAADDVCQASIDQLLDINRGVSLGKPIANMSVFVVDKERNLVPCGIPGEICVAGIGVGAGYWRQEEKTKAAFVENPFSRDEDDKVLYRTGDLGRWREDGSLEFLGRIDAQVKIRGFRIELGEIEAQVQEACAAREVVVLPQLLDKADNEKHLVAYVVSSEEIDLSDLRDRLSQKLPYYMVPEAVMTMDVLPLLPNGKVNRKALPIPERTVSKKAATDELPLSGMQKEIAAIWSDVLQVECTSARENFFELGGHSLKAMQIISRIQKAHGIKVSIADFFAAPTIQEIAAIIEGGNSSVFDSIPPAPEQEHYDLSHAQQRLWLQHNMGSAAVYNMPLAFTIHGKLDSDCLNQAFGQLVTRHEALRTTFVTVDDEPKQKVLDAVDFAVELRDVSGEDAAKVIIDEELLKPFDLETAPLVRVVLLKESAEKHIMLMVMHHIIGDGWSENVLFHELITLYNALRNNVEAVLPDLRIQYKDFTYWQYNQDMSADEGYWMDRMQPIPKPLPLPYDNAVSDEDEGLGAYAKSDISSVDRDALQELASKHKTTLSTVIFSLYSLVLYQIVKRDDICIGTSIANRNHPDVESMMGFFVNILPIRLSMSGDMDFDQLLGMANEAMQAAFEHQNYPFDQLIQKLNPERSAGRQPIINAVYAFQNFDDIKHDGIGSDENVDDLSLEAYDMNIQTAKFDLTLFVSDEESGLKLDLEYDATRFNPNTAARIVDSISRFAKMLTGQKE